MLVQCDMTNMSGVCIDCRTARLHLLCVCMFVEEDDWLVWIETGSLSKDSSEFFKDAVKDHMHKRESCFVLAINNDFSTLIFLLRFRDLERCRILFMSNDSPCFIQICQIIYLDMKSYSSSASLSNDVLCHRSIHNGSGGGAFIRLTEG